MRRYPTRDRARMTKMFVLNTRGGFKCYKIECPEGYDRDSAHAK